MIISGKINNLLSCLLLFCSLNSLNAQHTGTLTDIDGNIYKTVIIGTQEWMAENLKTTRYNDGSSIQYIPGHNNTAWKSNTTGAYSWYPDDEASYKETYGGLYNWYAVKTGRLCPAGWHVPTDKEWTVLENFVADSVYFQRDGIEQWVTGAGLVLKSENGWNGTDEFGFNALPGGRRDVSGSNDLKSGYAFWWTSTEYSSINAWHRIMVSNRDFSFRYANSKSFGFSVRCIRDL